MSTSTGFTGKGTVLSLGSATTLTPVAPDQDGSVQRPEVVVRRHHESEFTPQSAPVFSKRRCPRSSLPRRACRCRYLSARRRGAARPLRLHSRAGRWRTSQFNCRRDRARPHPGTCNRLLRLCPGVSRSPTCSSIRSRELQMHDQAGHRHHTHSRGANHRCTNPTSTGGQNCRSPAVRLISMVFDFEAIADAEEITGRALLTGLRRQDIEAPSINLVRAMAFACIHKRHSLTTFEQVKPLVTTRQHHRGMGQGARKRGQRGLLSPEGEVAVAADPLEEAQS